MSRPTSYREEYSDLAYKFCLLGATDVQLADFFDVCEQTINNWKHDHWGFLESLKRGKAIADAEVATSLFRRALGYEHPEDKVFNDGGKPLIVPTIKHYPPDSTAAIFWLKNRMPGVWQDRRDVNVTADMGKWVINAQPSESIEDWASKHGVTLSESRAKAVEHDGNGSGRVEPDDD